MLTLDELLTRLDLKLTKENGRTFIALPQASYGDAFLLKTMLDASVPGYYFTVEHYILWGYVVQVHPIRNDPSPAEETKAYKYMSDALAGPGPVGPYEMIGVTPQKTSRVKRETPPALIDAFDVTLALMIGEAMLDARGLEAA